MNPEEFCFDRNELEYLGFKITREGIMPLPDKLETLKEFRYILLSQQIKVYIDDKNLTNKTFKTDQVMQWRRILEEYSPELIYIQGSKNIAADALS